MIRGMRIATMLGAVVLLASACGTDGNTPLFPKEKPAFDGLGTGGNVTGGGNDGGQSSTTSPTSSETTTASDTTVTVGRGGLGTGGN